MREAIINYLRYSGLVPQSVDELLPELPRWERHLRRRGISSIPSLPVRDYSPTAAWACNELNLLIRQSARRRDSQVEHDLRNLTRIRPYKP
jgi:hypothetical protein